MSSRADDFDVRYHDAGDGRPGAATGYGGYGSAGIHGATVDYDLGYGEQGFDTEGFRSPEASLLDGPGPGYQRPADPVIRTGNGRAGGHARTAGPREAGPREAGRPRWEPDTIGRGVPLLPGGPAGNGRRSGPAGPSGPGRGGPGWPAGPRAKVKGSWWRHWTLRKALGVLAAGIGALIVLGAIAVAVAYEETPVPSDAMAATAFAQSVVYSSNGTLIGRFGTTDRQMLNYDEIPQNIIDAVLAAEDRHFMTEGGISPTAIVRAAFADITGNDGSLQGGSTITQQFVRNYYQGIGTQQTLSRKIKEIFVAMKIAKEKSKQWILTNYLNTIYLGDGSYGIGAAAKTYFGKPVGELSVAQDAVIAALIQQPSTYPLPQYRSQLEARWHYVLGGMVQMGTLSAQQAATLKFPKLWDYVPQSIGNDVWDPYILNMVYTELTQVYHFTQSQIYNGGYIIHTTIDDADMAGLYQAVAQNEAQIDADSTQYPFQDYMHVGAVLENPATGAIEALYGGPGFTGSRYNGTGPVITARQCSQIRCQWNMAVQNREQVGSSFKPYILATAVKEGMNVQTSTLDGYDNLCIPPDTEPSTYPVTASVNPVTSALECQASWYGVANDDAGENGPYTPQMAMAESINTAYTDLWHVVAGQNGASVVQMAQEFGVNTGAAGITAGPTMEDEAGIALGQASLTVLEQASMLATIDDNGVYHDAHVIQSITQNGVATPIKITSYLVFSPSPQLNAEEDSQVQYAMSEDTAPYGTAPTAAMSNGQEIIAKTGTTNTAQSAFFIGAMPTQALAVALFTSNQTGNGPQSLNYLGGLQQGGYGGTWPAAIWHTYAENMFIPLGVEQFQPAVFTGNTWNLVPPNLRHPRKNGHKKQNGQANGNPTGQPSAPPNPNPYPYPTYSCDPKVVTCQPGAAGGVFPVFPVFTALPVTCLWLRRRARRVRRRGRERG